MNRLINLIVICALGSAFADRSIANESQPTPPKRIAIAALETTYAVPQNSPEVNQDFVRQRVIESFQDIPVMIAIAECESEFRQYREDGTLNVNRLTKAGKRVSSATGVYQALYKGHYAVWSKNPVTNITTLDGNIAFARQLYEESGTAPWNESRDCWQPKVTKYKKLVKEVPSS
jgi:hypothetical protein